MRGAVKPITALSLTTNLQRLAWTHIWHLALGPQPVEPPLSQCSCSRLPLLLRGSSGCQGTPSIAGMPTALLPREAAGSSHCSQPLGIVLCISRDACWQQRPDKTC